MAVVTQTADPLFRTIDWAWLPALRVLYDGRNSLRTVDLPESVAYHGAGVPAALRAGAR